MYNAINFNSGTSAAADNLTIGGVRIASLVCPSDLQNETIAIPATQTSPPGTVPGWSWNETRISIPSPPGSWTQAFTSYAGNAGTFTFGFSNLMPPTVLTYFNGVIYNDSAVKIAAITDGTSNTFIFGEHSKGHLYLLDPGYAVSDNCWNSGPLVRHALRHALSRSIWPSATTLALVALRMPPTTIPRLPAATIPAEPTSASATARSGSSRTRSAHGRSRRPMPTHTATPCLTTRRS